MRQLKVVPMHVEVSYQYSKEVDARMYYSVLYMAPKELVKDALTIGTGRETEEAKVLRTDLTDSLKYDLGSQKAYFRDLQIEKVSRVDLNYACCQLYKRVG